MTTRHGLASAILYGCVSASMVFGNKAVFATLNFPFPSVVLLLQMLVTIAALPLLARATRGGANAIELPVLSLALARRFALPSALYCANVGLGLFSLGALSIPVYQVLKRLTPLASLVLAALVLKKKASREVVTACCAIVVGSMLVANGDIRFDAAGYAMALGSVACQSVYLTLVQRHGQTSSSVGTEEAGGGGVRLSSFGVLYVNAVNCIPMLVLFAAIDGEALGALAHPQLLALEPAFIAKLLLLLVLGGLLNYLLFLCTILNSALTTCIVGAVKAVAVTIAGFFVFGGQPLTHSMVLGVIVNTGGGILYIFAKKGYTFSSSSGSSGSVSGGTAVSESSAGV